MWKQALIATGLPMRKLVKSVNTRFASLLASFQSILECKSAVLHLYANLMSSDERLPKPLLWEVATVVYLK